MKKISLIPIIILIISIIIFNSSCKKDQTLIATSIELVSGNNQSAYAGYELENPIELIVKDQNGNPFEDATVVFSISEGSVSSMNIKTDATGNASVSWILGATEGSQTLTVTAKNPDGTSLTGSPITVIATATEAPLATSIELISGGDQTAEMYNPLENPIEIVVKDQYGNPFIGATVNFSVTEGSVSNTEVITDTEGESNVIWTLGSTIGTQTMTIEAKNAQGTALSGSPITVNATATILTSVTDIDGNTYSVVFIGDQIWMAENLKVSHYDNEGVQGDDIPVVTDDNSSGSSDDEWAAFVDENNEKAHCFFDDDNTTGAGTYGALYTWAGASNGESGSANPSTVQGACPYGWHLPSDEEWKELELHLGMSDTEVDNTGYRGTDEGGKLKESGTIHWLSPNTGATNSSNFTALPSGYRYNSNGSFDDDGWYGYWWSATENGIQAWTRCLSLNFSTIYRGDNSKSAGCAVRCVKD